jgi:hypothetical protein
MPRLLRSRTQSPGGRTGAKTEIRKFMWTPSIFFAIFCGRCTQNTGKLQIHSFTDTGPHHGQQADLREPPRQGPREDQDVLRRAGLHLQPAVHRCQRRLHGDREGQHLRDAAGGALLQDLHHQEHHRHQARAPRCCCASRARAAPRSTRWWPRRWPPAAPRRASPLGFPWETADPFLFCAYHDDAYPQGQRQDGAGGAAGRARHRPGLQPQGRLEHVPRRHGAGLSGAPAPRLRDRDHRAQGPDRPQRLAGRHRALRRRRRAVGHRRPRHRALGDVPAAQGKARTTRWSCSRSG